MTIQRYRNRRNPNKYIEVKRYACGNYYFRQFMRWDTPHGLVVNYLGARSNRGVFRRNGIRNMKQVLVEDYELVG